MPDAAGRCCNDPQRELSDVPYVEVPGHIHLLTQSVVN